VIGSVLTGRWRGLGGGGGGDMGEEIWAATFSHRASPVSVPQTLPTVKN